jgi:hypothetical protein
MFQNPWQSSFACSKAGVGCIDTALLIRYVVDVLAVHGANTIINETHGIVLACLLLWLHGQGS